MRTPRSAAPAAPAAPAAAARPARRVARLLLVGISGLALAVGLGAGIPAGTAHAAAKTPAGSGTTTTDFSFDLTGSPSAGAPTTTPDRQGFSVETADFAHGFLTKDRMAARLRTLGRDGVVRLGGYSMDLVWPAFGPAAHTPAPSWAIGGTTDVGDLVALRRLLDATGWRVTLGAPLLSVLNGQVSTDQVVAEVQAARRILGPRLTEVEVGNEYDHVTTLTPAQYYDELKSYWTALQKVAPGIRMTGPSANTAKDNTKLSDFVAAANADTTTSPDRVLREVSSHWYPASHCGTSTTTVPKLLASDLTTRDKLTGAVAADAGFRTGPLPTVINETNSASCSGMPGVSDSYASALWALDYQLQAGSLGVTRLQFHTNTYGICGDLKARDSSDYPISFRWYGAWCAADQAQLDAGQMRAAPLYYGLWAFRQLPAGRYLPVAVGDADLGRLRAYATRGAHGETDVVLINPQDPAAGGVSESVGMTLPRGTRCGSAVTLASSDPAGLESENTAAITLGGQQVRPDGRATGWLHSSGVRVDRSGSATVSVPAGQALILRFR